MKYVYTLLIFFVFAAFCGCLDDKTNLDYSDILLPDSVVVTNLSTGRKVLYDASVSNNGTYTVEPGMELQLDAEVFYRGDDEIVCEWHFEGKSVGTGVNLRSTFEKEGTGMLLVHRKKAGNAVCYRFFVKIQKTFGSGIFVVAKNQGTVKLDFIQSTYATERVEFGGSEYNLTLYDFNVRDDIYASLNGGTPLNMQNPVKLFHYRGFNWDAGVFYGLQILDESWQNSVTVGLDDMKLLATMKDEFVVNPQNLQAQDFVNNGAMNLLLDKSGKVYARVNYDYGNPCTGKYSSIPLAFDAPDDIPDKGALEIKADRLFPSNMEPATLIYEKEKSRFLIMTAVNSTDWALDYCYITDFSAPYLIEEPAKGCVDLNRVDKELVTAFFSRNNYGDFFLLFKEGTDCYLQAGYLDIINWDMPFQVYYTAKAFTKLPAEVGGLLSVGESCFDFAENDLLYFTSGNRIYSIDASGKNLKKVFEFPQKDKITKLRMMRPWNEESASGIDRYHNGRVFCAAFDNGDFKVVKLYDDPDKPGEEQYKFWVEKHYDGGVFDVLYYPYVD